MKPLEQIQPDGEEQHWEAGSQAKDKNLEDRSGEIEDPTAKAEAAKEAAELRAQLEEINPKIEQLNRKMELVMKSPLTDRESAERDAYVQKMKADAERDGSHPEITQRIGEVAREQFEKNVRTQHIKNSPQGQELERLKTRQFDMQERLQQLESDK